MEGPPSQQGQVNPHDDRYRELVFSPKPVDATKELGPVRTVFHVGIDDTDSRLGGCTTHTASTLFHELEARGFRPIDYPWIVRLNPNIPFKTRGNGALSLHFHIDTCKLAEAKEIALEAVAESVDLTQPRTDPAVVFLSGAIPTVLTDFSERALRDLISIPEAREVANEIGAEVHLFKGSRGLVGALASIGANLGQDHTFEIIGYRKEANIGSPRRVDHNSVREMDTKFHGLTFSNIDPETGRILVCPHGPDPVLLGIRGEDPEVLRQAFDEIRIGEEVENTMIFRTNQGTDAHLKFHRTIDKIKSYQSIVIAGKVRSKPRIIRGGHAVLTVEDETGSVECASYRETGSLRDTVLQLVPGDSITLSGGVRPFQGRLTLNVEKVEITNLVDLVRIENPQCVVCGARCESMGKNQGIRCKNCKTRFPRTMLTKMSVPRKVRVGTYLPPPRAHRHLTKPISRYWLSASETIKVVNYDRDMPMVPRASISTTA